METDKKDNGRAQKDAQSAQRQSPNQDIANDANNSARSDKLDGGDRTASANEPAD